MEKIMKGSLDPIELEKNIQAYMWKIATEAMETVLGQINQTIKEENQKQGWKVKRNDYRTVQYIFGSVQYKRTLMEDPNGENHYPLDKWLGIESYQRYSPLVEVQVAELASDATYRDTANFIDMWTPVDLSHQKVKTVVEKVGNIQAEYDQAIVSDLQESATLPEGKKLDFMYAEADGVFVRGTEKNKKIEIHHGLTYEGWEKNGKRVALKQSKTILTTRSISKFWEEVQTLTAQNYSLENTKVITNSDGGAGYTAEKISNSLCAIQVPRHQSIGCLPYYARTQSYIWHEGSDI